MVFHLLVLTLLVSLVTSRSSNVTVHVFRHEDKPLRQPAQGPSAKGIVRSVAFAQYLINQSYAPFMIMGTNAFQNGNDFTSPIASGRPTWLALVAQTAVNSLYDLTIPVYTPYRSHNIVDSAAFVRKKAVEHLQRGIGEQMRLEAMQYNPLASDRQFNEMIMVWNHKDVDSLMGLFGISNAPKWDSDDFDSQFTFMLNGKGKYIPGSFIVKHNRYPVEYPETNHMFAPLLSSLKKSGFISNESSKC